MAKRWRVGILGATGVVGQQLIRLLDAHPQFEVTALAASERSQGLPYAEACQWRLPEAMSLATGSIIVQPPRPPLACDLIISSLPANVARNVEIEFAQAGYKVVSNSSAHRMDDYVPLVIPEVNPDHLQLIKRQQKVRRSEGFIVTNPNCSTIMLALALAPLHERFGVEAVVVTTMQALSGAGFSGVAALDITDNVLPFIAGEEEKIERETLKILGSMEPAQSVLLPATMRVSAQCHRVNVLDGHMAAVRVSLARRAALEEVRDALASFTALPQQLKLYSAPARPLIVREEADRPQPRLDRDAGCGMSVTIGRLAHDPVHDFRFVALSHNTIRGAAGAALLNTELLLALGHLSN